MGRRTTRATRPSLLQRTARGGARLTGGLTLLVALAMVPLMVLVMGTWLSGGHLGFVRTGSMDPAIPPGSLIVTNPVTADDVAAGMVIEFVDPADPERIVTHRVQRVERDDAGTLSFVTKGDNNPDRDTEPVPPENVRAKVRWHVEGLGGLLWSMRFPRTLLFVVVPLMLVMVGSVLRRIGGDEPEQESVATAGPGPALDAACPCCAAGVGSADRYCRTCGRRLRRTPVCPVSTAAPSELDTAGGRPRRSPPPAVLAGSTSGRSDTP